MLQAQSSGMLSSPDNLRSQELDNRVICLKAAVRCESGAHFDSVGPQGQGYFMSNRQEGPERGPTTVAIWLGSDCYG